MCDSSSPLPQASAFDAKVALLLWRGLSKLLLWGQVIAIEKKFKGADKKKLRVSVARHQDSDGGAAYSAREKRN